eukprot:4430635-Pyramimonas_sp.AAC.1
MITKFESCTRGCVIPCCAVITYLRVAKSKRCPSREGPFPKKFCRAASIAPRMLHSVDYAAYSVAHR